MKMNPAELQTILDELRGELDRKHGQDPGWSGPATNSYMLEYGRHPRQKDFDESNSYHEAHIAHGWHT
jgi:hypothetical protein